jgi:hypothetical protein
VYTVDIDGRVKALRRKTTKEVLAQVPDTTLGNLFRRAYDQYGAKCFWNCKPSFSNEGIDVVVGRLQKYGDLRAWHLAADIDEERLHVSEKTTGLIEAVVTAPDNAPTLHQWVQSGRLNYFAPVVDPDFGYRLHYADLAVNKVDAAASRREVRDFVDLFLINEHIMPLWHAIWAAPGKNEQFSPGRIVEELRRKNTFTQAQVDEEIDTLVEIDASEMGRTITDALNRAEEIFKLLPSKLAGNLFLDSQSQLVNYPGAIILGLGDGSVRPVGPAPDRAVPTNPDIDRALVHKLIEEFGYKGSKLHDI